MNTNNKTELAYISRFLSYITIEESGCWEWQGGLNKYGYGQFWDGEHNKRAHRYSYELFRGVIPDGLQLDHLCRNRKCVNPNHLEVVTNHINGLRGNSPTSINAHKTYCVNGHPFNEVNTGKNKHGRYCKECNRINAKERSRAISLTRNKLPNYNAIKTHCPKGHPYNKDNTILVLLKTGNYGRRCRICNRLSRRLERTKNPYPKEYYKNLSSHTVTKKTMEVSST